MREHGRRRMAAFVAAAALLLLGAGCAKKEPIREAEAMADAICKCKDFECALEARKVGTARLAKWKDARGTEDEAKQVGAALARSESCDQKLRATAAPAAAPGVAPGASGAPGVPPAAPAPAPAPAPGAAPAAPPGASK